MSCCDGCERAYHLSCVTPPIQAVPDGKWHCSHCRIIMSNMAGADRVHMVIECADDDEEEDADDDDESVEEEDEDESVAHKNVASTPRRRMDISSMLTEDASPQVPIF